MRSDSPGSTLSGRVSQLAGRGEGLAFATATHTLSWGDYDRRSAALAATLVRRGVGRGDRVAVWMDDGAGVHVALLAAQRAGAVAVGIGPRAGDREFAHLMGRTGARVVVADGAHAGRSGPAVVTVSDDAGDVAPGDGPGLDIDPESLWLINSTSGTTGLPKCVMHTQARWYYFHALAVEAARLGADDVFASVLPAPFGFGLWTAHVTPTLLGVPCVVTARYDAEETIELIERFGVTVLCAVTTQFLMLLNAPGLSADRLASLRVLFTGGEAIPPAAAAEFEDRTGATVLQFYGSNETGALSRTTLTDPGEVRWATAGHVIEAMQVRLFAPDDDDDITPSGGPGIPGCKGPAMSLGYYDDPAANAQLFTPDGWMLTGDLATIDRDGVLRVVGRSSDIIIRGGKNISAAAVEAEVATHPAVALCAAVPFPDPVFGERVALYAVLRPGMSSLDVATLAAHLDARGVGKESWPERVVVVADLPRSSGGKIAKDQLLADARRLVDAR
jgi:acyl-CoA synthetase